MDDSSARTRTAPAPRQVAIVAFPGVQSLDVTGPLEVFDAAARLIEATGRRERGYEVQVVTREGVAFETSSGLTLTPHAPLARCARELDTLIVAGGAGSREAAGDGELVRWIEQTAPRAPRTAHRLGLHGCLPAGERRAAGWPACDHALGGRRGARKALPRR